MHSNRSPNSEMHSNAPLSPGMIIHNTPSKSKRNYRASSDRPRPRGVSTDISLETSNSSSPVSKLTVNALKALMYKNMMPKGDRRGGASPSIPTRKGTKPYALSDSQGFGHQHQSQNPGNTQNASKSRLDPAIFQNALQADGWPRPRTPMERAVYSCLAPAPSAICGLIVEFVGSQFDSKAFVNGILAEGSTVLVGSRKGDGLAVAYLKDAAVSYHSLLNGGPFVVDFSIMQIQESRTVGIGFSNHPPPYAIKNPTCVWVYMNYGKIFDWTAVDADRVRGDDSPDSGDVPALPESLQMLPYKASECVRLEFSVSSAINSIIIISVYHRVKRSAPLRILGKCFYQLRWARETLYPIVQLSGGSKVRRF